MLVPVVLAKLWSVMPKLFAWPPWRSVAHFLERLSLVLVVGGVVFEMVTGMLYIDYANRTNFYSGHFYGAWAFMAGFVVHVSVKFADMVRALRSRRLRTELRTGLAGTRPEPSDGSLVAPAPAPPTISRRGILALVGGTSLAVFVLTAGQSIGGAMRSLALFGTHYRSSGTGANDFPVNYTAASVGITPAATGTGWRLVLGGGPARLAQPEQLLAMPLVTADLPIACTEGWSTQQRWTGGPWPSWPVWPASRIPARPDLGARFAFRCPVRLPGVGARFDAGPSGQRRRPVPRPRVPGPGDRPVGAGDPQPQVDVRDRLLRADMKALRRYYGAGPAHLVGLLACFAVAAYAVTRVLGEGAWVSVFQWFVACLVFHDFVAWPAYTAADRLLLRAQQRRAGRHQKRSPS